MQEINLYRYEINGQVTVTPNRRSETDVPSRIRLIADNGYILINGGAKAPAIDIAIEDIPLWNEIVEEEPQTEIELKAQAYDILMGVSE